MVADMRNRMSLFVPGLSQLSSKEGRATMLIRDMDISRLIVYVQQVEEEKLRDREEFRSKRAKTGNESGQQKGNANRSSFQQRQRGPAPSVVRAPAPRYKGSIPKPLWNLTSIEGLDLGYNYLEGPISDFFRFGKIKLIYLRNNNFDGQLDFRWMQLNALDFSFNSITGPIPSNVSSLQNLQLLHLSSKPSWIFSLPSLFNLDLGDNHFSGNIHEFKSKTLFQVSLKQNQLEGPIPKSLLNQSELYYLLLSHNNLSGQIASTICNLTILLVLDLGSNNLEGTIPLCLGEVSELSVLDLSNNSLSGTINTNFSIGNQLMVIKFDGNKLEGKVPQSLINCKYLEVLGLGNNELSDIFPKWLGALPELQILNLRSNKFYGPIKDSRTDNLFAQIRVIDLSSNRFSGDLPVSLFENFEAMKMIGKNSGTREYVADILSVYYTSSFIVTTKGLELELPRVLTTNIIINLSNNRFEGHIPSIIGDLVGLRMLNLSHNRLEGQIPASLHQLSVLESLELSLNKISGEIPQQLASLTFLAVLNLSHNHLVGCIPKGKQFDTFENSSYQENDWLRGLPLSKDCGGDEGVPQTTNPIELDEEEEEEEELAGGSNGLRLWTCYWTVHNIHNVVNSISSMVFEDGCKIGTQNSYENEKAQEKTLVCNLQHSSLLHCWDVNKSLYFHSL
ncbi:receptor-like protein Cf-9 homolog [Solanum stenotomum]|uniref:receptor-like protein Cf-9 homolog n=1 Tax=Solanum stenotomum TaxID=172797 RepID=UPI0020D0792C|nr:receptor-like protein Cf-9 homolog [Solanum stenotomum]